MGCFGFECHVVVIRRESKFHLQLNPLHIISDTMLYLYKRTVTLTRFSLLSNYGRFQVHSTWRSVGYIHIFKEWAMTLKSCSHPIKYCTLPLQFKTAGVGKNAIFSKIPCRHYAAWGIYLHFDIDLVFTKSFFILKTYIKSSKSLMF